MTNPPWLWRLTKWAKSSFIFSAIKFIVQRFKGRFPLSQNFQKFGNSGKWYRNFSEKFLEIPEAVEFPKWEPFNQKFYLEIQGPKMNGKKSSVKKFSNIWVFLVRLSLFCGSFEKYCTVCYWKLPKIQSGRLVEWKAPKISLRKLFFAHCVFSSRYELIFILVGQFCKIDINFDQ